MPTTLEITAVEKSTLVVTVSFTDHSGAAATPTAMAWTLTDGAGAVVNGRSAVAISPLASTVYIVLHGDDLALPDPGDPVRRITLQGTYDSSLGAGFELKDQATFSIEDLKGVA